MSVDLPIHEIERKARVDALYAALEKEWSARVPALILPPKLEEGEESVPRLACPFCQCEDLGHGENAGIWRDVNGFYVNDDENTLHIESHYDVNDEMNENEHLECRSCYNECSVPDGLNIEWD